jgi:hypothetical protein
VDHLTLAVQNGSMLPLYAYEYSLISSGPTDCGMKPGGTATILRNQSSLERGLVKTMDKTLDKFQAILL